MPEILWYYQALADALSRKAAEEVREQGEGRLSKLAGELESAVAEVLGFAGEARFEARALVSG